MPKKYYFVSVSETICVVVFHFIYYIFVHVSQSYDGDYANNKRYLRPSIYLRCFPPYQPFIAISNIILPATQTPSFALLHEAFLFQQK